MMDRGLIPYQRLLDLFIGVARGLAAAHARGIVHRDVKPDNILLTRDGEPKIVDFGLAKSHKALLKTTRVTKSGTPAYMAPEQAEDHPARPIDFRADIFAFGVTLYEAITGHNPFEGRSLFTTLDNIINRDPPDPTRSNVELGDLGRIVRRCLQKKPEDRYVSTKDLVGDLEGLRGTWQDGTKSNRIWWEVHQLGTTAFYAAILVFMWWVHPLARPEAASRALALLGVLVGSALGTVRLHFWFASRQGLVKLADSIRRFGPWVARGDVVLSAILFGMSGLFLYTDRPNTAVVFVILAVVNLGLTFIIEPAAKADAFPEDDDERNRPPQGPPSAPAA